MKKTIKLNIDEPCHEDWNKMTPKEQGRYCNSCAKVVIDFSGWSDARISDYLKSNKEEETCGNFFEDQLNRPILPSFQEPANFNLKAVLLGASLTSLLTLESCRSSKKVVGKFGFSETRMETTDNRSNDRRTEHVQNPLLLNKKVKVYHYSGSIIDSATHEGISESYVTFYTDSDVEIDDVISVKDGKFEISLYSDRKPSYFVVMKSGYTDKKILLKAVKDLDSIEVLLAKENENKFVRGRVIRCGKL